MLPKGASTKLIYPGYSYETRSNQPQVETDIKDILLNVDFLEKTIRNSLTSNGQIEVKSFYDRVFTGIEQSTGGINKFELHCDDNNTFYIVDRKYIELTEDKPEPLYLAGLSSIVKNISLVSKLSPNISSLIAISAQDKSSDLGLDATSFRKLNSGLEDRIIGEKNSGTVFIDNSPYIFAEDSEEAVIRVEKTEQLETLRASIAKLYKGTDSVEANRRGLQSLYSGFINIALEKSTLAHASFAIPFELTLTIDGTGGFTVGETFEINGDILPLTYKETVFNGSGFSITPNSRVGFIITGLEQNVSSAGWNTIIKSQIYLNSKTDVAPRTYKIDPQLVDPASNESTGADYRRPLDPLIPRGSDSQGSGEFGASRGTRVHQGRDYVSTPGQRVYAPITGRVSYGPAYNNNSRPELRKVKIIGVGEYKGQSVSLLYVDVETSLIGAVVRAGTFVGRAQDMAQYYDEGMTNHVHLAIYKGSLPINPANQNLV